MRKFNRILAGFNKTIARLEDLAVSKAAEVNKIVKKQKALVVKKIDAGNESAQASLVAKKLKDLVG